MMNEQICGTLLIDLEVRSRVDLTEVGQHAFARDPSTQVLLVSYKLNHEPTEVWCPLDSDVPPRLLQAFASPMVTLVSFGPFDPVVLEEGHGERLGLPPVSRFRWRDAQSISLAHNLSPSLKGTARALRLDVEKDERGKELIKLFCMPNKKARFVEPTELKAEFRAFREYAARDVDVLAAIIDKLGYLSSFEEAVYHSAYKMNARGFPVDRRRAELLAERVEKLQRQANEQATAITGVNANSPVAMLRWLRAETGLEIGSTGEAEAAIEGKIVPDRVRRALKYREVAASKAVSKLPTILASTVPAADGSERLKGQFVYCGASMTSRFSARGVQPQNFKRPTIKSDAIEDYWRRVEREDPLPDPADVGAMLDEIEKAGSVMRSLISHPRGMAWADLAGIELRVVGLLAAAWLRDQGGSAPEGGDIIADVLAGRDLYVGMGTKIAHILGEKDVTPQNAKERGWRQYGKTAMLSLQYGTGAERFSRAVKDGTGRDITIEQAGEIVKAYRETYVGISGIWKWLSESMIVALSRGERRAISGFGYIERAGEHVRIVKPSGSFVWYRNPKIEQTKGRYGFRHNFTYEIERNAGLVRQEPHGGMLFEHWVSSISRDLIAHAMVEAERAGLELVMTIHDELVVIGGEGEREALHDILKATPEWATGWPIDCESETRPSWGK